MAPVTDFHIKEKYTYLNGFGSYHGSEALPDASPLVNNSPQKPPYGLRTERISGTAFTAPRHQNLQTFMYRISSSIEHSTFIPHGAAPKLPTNLTPNAYMWPSFSCADDTDWTRQELLAGNGDPSARMGCALWLFAITKDMPERTASSSLDGDQLIIPQAGTLDIQTELGKLLVRQNEIAVIPRGIRYRVTLPAGAARGYVCELFQSHFQLPELGAIGSTGLANVRDFQIPTAYFDGELKDGVARAHDTGEWTMLSRLGGRLWSCAQNRTPFDVVAWHVFDEHDPSLFVVLTAPSGDPGAGVVDFAIVPPRWKVTEDTLRIPYYHRNVCPEFYGPIISAQDPMHPLNAASEGNAFFPFCAGLNGNMATHGAAEEDFQRNSNEELKPTKTTNDGYSIFLLETQKPLFVSDWAEEAAKGNSRPKKRGDAKM
ncbi:homogentisate 1,2-dioxygenase [Lecanosticta acicola]|uniref:homogentisate 1,2-dioxygenase n=1 Tax=Lecanosticta acicola TaxID=111012 RepID=A0AAI8Z218_9PEZI|nr:homogentisate 1,2-dioxygenase [Lecanosticta acicola]